MCSQGLKNTILNITRKDIFTSKQHEVTMHIFITTQLLMAITENLDKIYERKIFQTLDIRQHSDPDK